MDFLVCLQLVFIAFMVSKVSDKISELNKSLIEFNKYMKRICAVMEKEY